MISDKELAITAELAQIEITDQEADSLRQAVSRMVEYFSSMAEVDVTGLEPMTHGHASGNRVRQDSSREFADTDSLLENAEDLEDRFIAVPNVL
ncbi:Asp-tRNA(Asn)/Glu-tRNA(Gln) amidotransferase subunit GatC [Spirochaeta africana]|uniref:Glutamyl-tRNA(Gln) amidotransferase subunit C n=1 Tax=Spirochaeta africana (strain ATCC 700263 / DSM 8902 / Z-7692) TaxID=889378 RepID=H9UMY4_SPIAZ|nr:Asp-tRNA(Asn)/Glu-tRNA(Gln) amidotransferase subunit GatC [Spirochaeta africana]AFG38877.1 glutamyl-tRNA(Gln) and/or aspartyl-tRNA(Asn) amidotransferase, C subunit [Spirochaeta africana DSM 8902]